MEFGASLKHFLFKSYTIEGSDVIAWFQKVGEIWRTISLFQSLKLWEKVFSLNLGLNVLDEWCDIPKLGDFLHKLLNPSFRILYRRFALLISRCVYTHNHHNGWVVIRVQFPSQPPPSSSLTISSFTHNRRNSWRVSLSSMIVSFIGAICEVGPYTFMESSMKGFFKE